MIIATCTIPNQYTVQLVEGDNHKIWFVTYGFQTSTFSEIEKAYEDFKSCCDHAATCEGWIQYSEEF